MRISSIIFLGIINGVELVPMHQRFFDYNSFEFNCS